MHTAQAAHAQHTGLATARQCQDKHSNVVVVVVVVEVSVPTKTSQAVPHTRETTQLLRGDVGSGDAAVHHEGGTRDVRRLVTGQEHHGVGHLLGLCAMGGSKGGMHKGVLG
jgi:hypothetical protein